MSSLHELPPAIQPLQCERKDCNFGLGQSCARQSEFLDPLRQCSSLRRHPGINSALALPLDLGAEPRTRSRIPSGSSDTDGDPLASRAPWSGRHVLDAELEPILAHAPARLIAVVGSFNAGKTALLTAFFLQLASGQKRGFPYRFASSRTLYAWQTLIEHAQRWSGSGELEIVTHTPRTLEQAQHLHVGLRPVSGGDDRHLDLLFSDLPGEWISSWVSLADEQNTLRLKFFARCDAYIYVLDASELVGSGPGESTLRKFDAYQRRILQRLVDLERPRAVRRPLLVLLCKWDAVLHRLDIPPDPASPEASAWQPIAERLPRTWQALQEAQALGITCRVAAVAAFPHRLDQGQPVGVMAPFHWLLEQVDARPAPARLRTTIPPGASPFETLRRWEDLP